MERKWREESEKGGERREELRATRGVRGKERNERKRKKRKEGSEVGGESEVGNEHRKKRIEERAERRVEK